MEHTSRTKCLLLIYPDGYVELYGPETLDVTVRSVPWIPTKQGEIQAEAMVEASLPIVARSLYGQDCLRATGQARRGRMRDLIITRTEMDLCRILGGLNG